MLTLRAARRTGVTVIWFVAIGFILGGPSEAQEGRWITAWGSSIQGSSSRTLTAMTVRMIARPTIAGDFVRVKLENIFSPQPLTIGDAYVALRNYRASLVPGSNRQLTFNGLPFVSIPAGGWAYSDPVALMVGARQDLAVSLYVPETNVPLSIHNTAFTTSYLTPNGAGNHAVSEDDGAFTATTTSMYWLSTVEVFSSSAAGAIIALGDSITNGTCSTVDAHERWEDVLAARMLLAGIPAAVVNRGIGGATLTLAKERLAHDVLEQAGVTHVILFLGTNDISRGASAVQVIADQQEIINRVKAAGLQIIGVTIIPRAGWDNTKAMIRHMVNAWIRTQAGFDTVLDFDAVVRDAANSNLINALFDCDGIHPNPYGYFVMGQSIDLGP